MIRDYGLHFYFETSALIIDQNIETVFRKTTSFMYLKYTNIQLNNEYSIPPKPIIIRISVVFSALVVLCFFWFILTSDLTKIQSLLFSLSYGFLDTFVLQGLRRQKEPEYQINHHRIKEKQIVIFFFPSFLLT